MYSNHTSIANKYIVGTRQKKNTNFFQVLWTIPQVLLVPHEILLNSIIPLKHQN